MRGLLCFGISSGVNENMRFLAIFAKKRCHMKSKVLKSLVFLLVGVFGTAAAFAQRTQAQPEMNTYTYATKDGEDLQLDVYVDPAFSDAGERPVMIFSYGGAWESGKKEDGKAFLEDFAREGYVAVGINYRLGIRRLKEKGIQIGEANFASSYSDAITMGVEDLYDATRFVLDRAGEWKIDPKKILICGSSAGAINSMTAEYLLCNDVPLATSRLPEGFNYAAVISCAGGVWVAGTDSLSWKKQPCPVLAFHGTKDQLVPFGKSVMGNGAFGAFGPDYFIPQLKAMEVSCIKHVFTESDHIIAGIYNNAQARREMFSFIERMVWAGEKLSILSTEDYYGTAPSLQALFSAFSARQQTSADGQ